jgi:hypothetical protein
VHHARAFCVAFFDAYHHEHRHAALGLHTPASVYYGTASEIRLYRFNNVDLDDMLPTYAISLSLTFALVADYPHSSC